METSTNSEVTREAQHAHPNNPLHGKTLAMILDELVLLHGFSELGRRIPINCFLNEPSIPSSLKFLRRTPWARAKVEDLYAETISRSYPT
jgi:uncharacterized protein (DUF2132 family)